MGAASMVGGTLGAALVMIACAFVVTLSIKHPRGDHYHLYSDEIIRGLVDALSDLSVAACIAACLFFEFVPRKLQRGAPTAFKWRVAVNLNLCTLLACASQRLMGENGGKSSMDVHVMQGPYGAGGVEGNPFIIATDTCAQQGFLQQFFFLSSFLWVALLAEAIYLDAGHHAELENLEKYEWQLFASIYSLGGLSVAAGQWFQIWGYMESGEWCWIRANYPWMRMGLFYGPLVLVMALLVGRTTQALTISSKIRAAVEAAGADPSLRGQLPNSRKLHQHASLWFCLAFVACRLPSVVNRLSSSFEAGWNTELVGASLETDVSLMEMAHDFGSPLQGVAVSLVLLLDRDLWEQMHFFTPTAKWRKTKGSRVHIAAACSCLGLYWYSNKLFMDAEEEPTTESQGCMALAALVLVGWIAFGKKLAAKLDGSESSGDTAPLVRNSTPPSLGRMGQFKRPPTMPGRPAAVPPPMMRPTPL